MKRTVRLPVVLAILSVLALLIAACGAAAPTPIPTQKPPVPTAVPAIPVPVSTPAPRPLSLREEVFEITKPFVHREFGVGEVTLVTSDGQKWPVYMLSDLRLKRFGAGYERTSDSVVTAQFISIDKYREYKGTDQKFVFISAPIVFSFVIDLLNSDEPVTAENRVFAHARETSACISCLSEWYETRNFPLAAYLFELDDASYRREIRHLALQVLDILFKGGAQAESK